MLVINIINLICHVQAEIEQTASEAIQQLKVKKITRVGRQPTRSSRTSAPPSRSSSDEDGYESDRDISGEESEDEFDPEKHGGSISDSSSSEETAVAKRGGRSRSPDLTDAELTEDEETDSEEMRTRRRLNKKVQLDNGTRWKSALLCLPAR